MPARPRRQPAAGTKHDITNPAPFVARPITLPALCVPLRGLAHMLVPARNPNKLSESFRRFMGQNARSGVEIEVEVLSSSPGIAAIAVLFETLEARN